MNRYRSTTKESKDSKLRVQFPEGILKDHSIRNQSTFTQKQVSQAVLR